MQATRYTFTESYQSLVVAAILQDPSMLPSCRDALQPEYFSSFVEQEIIRMAVSYYDMYRERPGRDTMVQLIYDKAHRVGWKDADRDQITTNLYRIYAIPLQESDLVIVRDKVAQFGRLQALKVAMMDSIGVIQDFEKGDEKADLASVETKVKRALLVGAPKVMGVDIGNVMPDMRAFCEDKDLSSASRRVLTGYPTIDKLLKGGLGAGEFGLILAPSNRGKSMVLANLAAAAYRSGKNTIYFSFEMKEAEVASRIAANLTDCTIADVQQNDPEYMSRVRAMQQVFVGRKLRIIYIKPVDATPNNIRSTIMNIESTEGWKPDALFIDYIDEMTVPSGSKSIKDDNTFKIGEFLTAELQSIGIDYMCPVWTASQVNRDGYLGDPELSDVGMSTRKIDKSDFVMSIVQSESQARDGRMTFKILKSRRSVKGQRINCVSKMEKATIYEIVT